MKIFGRAAMQTDGGPGRPLPRVLGETAWNVAVAAAVIGALTAANSFLLHLSGYRAMSILYLLAITCLSLFLNIAAVIFAAALSAFLWIYLFIPPRLAILGASFEDTLMFLTYFISAFVSGVLTSRLRSSRRKLEQRERRIEFLYAFARALSEESDPGRIMEMSLRRISAHFGGETVILLRSESGGLEQTSAGRRLSLTQADLDAAGLCLDSRMPAGRFTLAAGAAGFHFVPLATPDTVIGVFGISVPEGRPWGPAQEGFLSTLARTLSISLEREELHSERQKALIARESERLGKILLNTVSHQMRTPLTAIQGAASSLLDEGAPTDPALRSALLTEVLEASLRLNNIVENLLSMNRLESGHLKLKRSTVDVEELISLALSPLKSESARHPVRISGPANDLAVSVDAALMVQVFINVFQNAFRHTPDGVPVQVFVRRQDRGIRAEIRDWGPGVPKGELPRLFEKFYRGENAPGGGTGLGLTICAGIVRAHGGAIEALLPEGGGLSIVIRLPDCIAEEGGT